jgi:hypothetical protein
MTLSVVFHVVTPQVMASQHRRQLTSSVPWESKIADISYVTTSQVYMPAMLTVVRL